jgi:predicted acetyltransferase
MDQGVTVGVERPFMMRLCDVKAGIELLRPLGVGNATFTVTDDIVPENSGSWLVEWGETGTTCQKSNRPGIDLSIQQLTQVLLGEPSYADLVRNNDLPFDESLNRLFGARPVYCPDFF